MKVVIVAAMARRRVIGSENGLPWHLPGDLAHFKALTLGKPIIMGRKTFDSIGKALPGRRNILISRQKGLRVEGVEVVGSLEEALKCVERSAEVMIVGGGSIYREAMVCATQMELTFIEADIHGDVYFPEWNDHEWREVHREVHHRDERNPYDYAFVSLVRH